MTEREKRGLNRLDPRLAIADTLLDRWGRFHLASHQLHAWSPTPLATFTDLQARVDLQPAGRHPTVIPDDIGLVDWVVARLDERRRSIVFSVYVHQREAPQEVQRHMLMVSKPVFNRELRAVREIVCMELDAFSSQVNAA